MEFSSDSILSIWNYALTFTSLAVFSVFMVDMIGHKTKSISTLVFSAASLAGIIAGEACVSLLSLDKPLGTLILACILATTVSGAIAYKYQTKDPEVNKKRVNRA